jgi:hypothetical protein
VSATHWYALESRGAIDAGAVDTIARVGGDAWAVAGDRYVLVASPLTAEATDLPLRASWVPWLGAAIDDHLSGDAGAITEVAPGASVARPPWARELEGPDGTRRPVRDLRIDAPDRPGVYFWLRGSARAGALVVNSEVSESDLTRLPLAELRSRFSGAEVTATADLAPWSAAAFAVSGRRALDAILLVIGLLFLAAEAFVTRAVPAKDER